MTCQDEQEISLFWKEARIIGALLPSRRACSADGVGCPGGVSVRSGNRVLPQMLGYICRLRRGRNQPTFCKQAGNCSWFAAGDITGGGRGCFVYIWIRCDLLLFPTQVVCGSRYARSSKASASAGSVFLWIMCLTLLRTTSSTSTSAATTATTTPYSSISSTTSSTTSPASFHLLMDGTRFCDRSLVF